ncbi:MAG: N-acetylmuramoyl-L-alanine amidase [Actinomycetaceae bacterium]|nr:N-acetylmuramoyl-L-alanine amidase [Actinomycetaceae bacterium]
MMNRRRSAAIGVGTALVCALVAPNTAPVVTADSPAIQAAISSADGSAVNLGAVNDASDIQDVTGGVDPVETTVKMDVAVAPEGYTKTAAESEGQAEAKRDQVVEVSSSDKESSNEDGAGAAKAPSGTANTAPVAFKVEEGDDPADEQSAGSDAPAQSGASDTAHSGAQSGADSAASAAGTGTAADPNVPSEELSIVRQPISSEMVIMGVTLPGMKYEPGMTFSYRALDDGFWGEWVTLDIAEPDADVDLAKAEAGTDPTPLVNVDQIEVVARSADGRAIPGAELSIVDPMGNKSPAALDIPSVEEVAGEAAQSGGADSAASGASESQDDSAGAEDKPAEAGDDASEGAKTETPKTGDTVADQDSDASGAVGKGQAGSASAAVWRDAEQGGAVPTAMNPAQTVYDAEFHGLKITTRKGWGADESMLDWGPDENDIQGAVIHHTAGSNNYTQDQVPGLIRGIYNYHANTLGWGDVGYHLLVDKFGGVWQGRAGGLFKGVYGAHAYGANGQTFGISVLGDYTYDAPPPAAMDSVAKAVAWKLRLHGITNIDRRISVPGAAQGWLPVVSGHRDVGGTACPGQAFYNRLGDVRASIKRYLSNNPAGGAKAQTPVTPRSGLYWENRVQAGRGWNVGQTLSGGDFEKNGRSDALLVKNDGSMWLYPGAAGLGFERHRQIGRGWQVMDQINAGIDFNNDGNTDVIAREKSSGHLWLYPGNGKGGFLARARIGSDWRGYSGIFTAANLVGDKSAILAVESGSGRLTAFVSDGRGGIGQTVRYGVGWNQMRSITWVGDRTGDGVNDVVAVDNKGFLFLYPNLGARGFAARSSAGQGWQGFSPLRTVNGDGVFWTVDGNGALWQYRLMRG